MVMHRSNLRAFGPAAVPWLLPLRDLVSCRPTASWTPLNQAITRTFVADGMWSPMRRFEAGYIDDGRCLLCGEPCTYFHRAFECSGRTSWRERYAMPAGIFDAALADRSLPLWTHALVADPTRALPPPSTAPPRWTVLPASGVGRFTGSAFGDGSGVQPFCERTRRCGFGVVQVGWVDDSWIVIACLVGPLPGPTQATPAAELCALVHFTLNADDIAGLMFSSDCAWVVDSFAAGRWTTCGAAAVHADLWCQLWDAHDSRVNPIRVIKVKALWIR